MLLSTIAREAGMTPHQIKHAFGAWRRDPKGCMGFILMREETASSGNHPAYFWLARSEVSE